MKLRDRIFSRKKDDKEEPFRCPRGHKNEDLRWVGGKFEKLRCHQTVSGEPAYTSQVYDWSVRAWKEVRLWPESVCGFTSDQVEDFIAAKTEGEQ